MSLRRKIFLLFGLLAVVPMMALAAFSYWQAKKLLRSVVQDQLSETALSVAEGLEDLGAGIQTSLMARAVSLQEPAPLLEASESPLEPSADTLLEGAVYLALYDHGGGIRLLAGSFPEIPRRCSDGVGSRLMRFTEALPDALGGGYLEAGFWGSDLLSSQRRIQNHSVTLLNAADGVVLAGLGCDGAEAGPWLSAGGGFDDSLRNPAGFDPVHFSGRDGALEGALAPVGDLGWDVVVTTSLTDVFGSLRRLAGLYWVLVLGLGLSTALAFSILIGRFTRSLSGLARAAEEIGLGELDPWLPVPTSGEVGQLTTAFSRMLERIRQMMNQVSQSGRLAVVGQLSAYLAHEIRNPLSSIKLNLQRLLRWTNLGHLPDYCREPLEISLREVERLNASVSGVLQLSRAHDAPKEVVELHGLLSEAVELVASRFRKQGVELSLDLDAEADLILARVGQLKSVALNLLVNALEAQPDGGQLSIRSALCRTADHEGPAVSLHFRDHGPGIPPEIRDRIFEPFFTTKPGGAGIGLAMAKQSVEESGGQLYLAPSYSRDSGAEFVVVFPLATQDFRDDVAAHRAPFQGRDRAPAGTVDPLGNPGGGAGSEGSPQYLLTPGGLKEVLTLSVSESEEIN